MRREIQGSRVLFGSTGPGSVLLEVTEQSGRIMSEVTKVDSLSTLPQQQQPVEDLEKFGGRLVNPVYSFSPRSKTRQKRKMTHVQRTACPLSAKVLRKLTIAQAL